VEVDMRDAIEMRAWADHGKDWSDWLYHALRNLRRAASPKAAPVDPARPHCAG
jgi:hypothetical protein